MIESFVPAPMLDLDAPVPQVVGQLADVLVLFGMMAPDVEQVIEVSKINLDQVSQRSSLRDPQLAELLVDVPVPESVVLAHGNDELGVRWCHRERLKGIDGKGMMSKCGWEM